MPDPRRSAAAAFDQLDDAFNPPAPTEAAQGPDPAPIFAQPAARERLQGPLSGRTWSRCRFRTGKRLMPRAPLPTVSLPERPALVREEEDYITTTFRYPRYVNRMMDEYLLDHPHRSKTSLFLSAMTLMGFAIDEGDAR